MSVVAFHEGRWHCAKAGVKSYGGHRLLELLKRQQRVNEEGLEAVDRSVSDAFRHTLK